MSRHLTQDQVEHFKEAFSLFDIDGGGSIDVDELGACMRFLGQNLSEKELNDMVERWDQSGTENINVEGFLNMLASHSDVLDVEETMIYAFSELDPSGSGTISKKEFIDMMQKDSDESGATAIVEADLDTFLGQMNLLEQGEQGIMVKYPEFVVEMMRL